MARPRSPLPGPRIGKWVVISFFGHDRSGQLQVLCVCSCGTLGLIRRSSLTTANSTGCGCKDDAADPTPAPEPHSSPGMMNWRAKLSNADIVRIRAACQAGVKQSVLAERFGVSQTVISNVGGNNAWKHV